MVKNLPMITPGKHRAEKLSRPIFDVCMETHELHIHSYCLNQSGDKHNTVKMCNSMVVVTVRLHLLKTPQHYDFPTIAN